MGRPIASGHVRPPRKLFGLSRTKPTEQLLPSRRGGTPAEVRSSPPPIGQLHAWPGARASGRATSLSPSTVRQWVRLSRGWIGYGNWHGSRFRLPGVCRVQGTLFVTPCLCRISKCSLFSLYSLLGCVPGAHARSAQRCRPPAHRGPPKSAASRGLGVMLASCVVARRSDLAADVDQILLRRLARTGPILDLLIRRSGQGFHTSP
jgi:hypothetical protein